MEILKNSGKEILIRTGLGDAEGRTSGGCLRFLGVPFARAGRFEYARPVENWQQDCPDGRFTESGTLDATEYGPGCPQCRQFDLHLEHPKRLFYHLEYRDGLHFDYDEQCLNLNIFAPENAENCPVIVFIYGGGFDSGSNAEQPFDGSCFASHGVITVFINYRVGVLGYMTHEEIFKRFGRDGNFGLDDQRAGIKWVKDHIADFGGDPENITVLGQSAGAISIQYLCIDPANKGLFQRAVMMSGAGQFPGFALPKKAEDTRPYWLEFMDIAGCRTFEELRTLGLKELFEAVEIIKEKRKDTIYNTMPVVDGVRLPRPVPELIKEPLPIDYMIGYTGADMFAPALAFVGDKFGKKNGAYIYYFDLEAPGDKNGAFHSADLRFVFNKLEESWRPYGPRDQEAADQLSTYIANFAGSGDPNGSGLPEWRPAEPGILTDVLKIGPQKTSMGRPSYLKLTKNYITRPDPKADPSQIEK